MSDATTKTDLAQLEDRLDKRFDELMTAMSQFAQDIGQRFEAAEDMQRSVDMRLARAENELAEVKLIAIDLKSSHDKLLNTIDGFVARIDGYETEMAARDRQMERLLAWARKVSDKTGIPLENL